MDGGSMPEKAGLCEGLLPVSVMISCWSFKEINSLGLLQHIWLTASMQLLVFNLRVLLMRRMRGEWSFWGRYCCWQHRWLPFFLCWSARKQIISFLSAESSSLFWLFFGVFVLKQLYFGFGMGDARASIWLTCFAVALNIREENDKCLKNTELQKFWERNLSRTWPLEEIMLLWIAGFSACMVILIKGGGEDYYWNQKNAFSPNSCALICRKYVFFPQNLIC